MWTLFCWLQLFSEWLQSLKIIALENLLVCNSSSQLSPPGSVPSYVIFQGAWGDWLLCLFVSCCCCFNYKFVCHFDILQQCWLVIMHGTRERKRPAKPWVRKRLPRGKAVERKVAPSSLCGGSLSRSVCDSSTLAKSFKSIFLAWNCSDINHSTI